MSAYFIDCLTCDATYQASYDTDGARWMERHDEECPGLKGQQ